MNENTSAASPKRHFFCAWVVVATNSITPCSACTCSAEVKNEPNTHKNRRRGRKDGSAGRRPAAPAGSNRADSFPLTRTPLAIRVPVPISLFHFFHFGVRRNFDE